MCVLSMHARVSPCTHVETFYKTYLHNGKKNNIIFLNRGNMVRPRVPQRTDAINRVSTTTTSNHQITKSPIQHINISTNNHITKSSNHHVIKSPY